MVRSRGWEGEGVGLPDGFESLFNLGQAAFSSLPQFCGCFGLFATDSHSFSCVGLLVQFSISFD